MEIETAVMLIAAIGGSSVLGVIGKGLFDKAVFSKSHDLDSTEKLVQRLERRVATLEARLDATEARLDAEQEYNARLVSHILAGQGPPPPLRLIVREG